jgi:hypothetical protein
MSKILLAEVFVTPEMRKNINTKGLVIDFEVKDVLDDWFDFSVEYNKKDNYYSLSFETILGFENAQKCRDWIIYCLDRFTEYMNEKGYSTDKELDLYEVFTEGINVNSHFETIEDAYAFMKFAVNGFHGEGLF